VRTQAPRTQVISASEVLVTTAVALSAQYNREGSPSPIATKDLVTQAARSLPYKLDLPLFSTLILIIPMMSATPERDEQLLAIGHQCSLPSCLLVDFLPFKCQHCNERFCAEHFTVDGHKCPKYDERKYNRVAPPCKSCFLVFNN
jgi:hypothetical protein